MNPPYERFETIMRRGGAASIAAASEFFMRDDPVFRTLRTITARLRELEIPYAVAGGMALVVHGYDRTTMDVDILVTPEGLATIHEKLDGLGYLQKNTARSKWRGFARPDGTFDFSALTAAQKEALYRECETIGDADVRPLNSAQRRLHAQVRRRGRPRKGSGVEIVSLSIEKDLLHRAERLAKAQGLSRSDLFSRGLRAVLAIAGAA